MSDQQSPSCDQLSRESWNFVEESLFRFLLHLEIQKAMRLRYPLSVLCMVPDIRPDQGDPPLTRHICEVVRRQLRSTDVVTTFSDASIGLLLIDAERPALPVIHNRIRAELEASRLALRGQERRVTWSAGGVSYPRASASGSALLRQAMDLMTQASTEGGNRLRLAP